MVWVTQLTRKTGRFGIWMSLVDFSMCLLFLWGIDMFTASMFPFSPLDRVINTARTSTNSNEYRKITCLEGVARQITSWVHRQRSKEGEAQLDRQPLAWSAPATNRARNLYPPSLPRPA